MRQKKGAFGVVYQDVMRNSLLDPESKALYAYLSSFSGDKNTCYPTLDMICKEMRMSKNRVNKYMNQLIEFNVIEKRRLMNGNLYGRTVYKLLHEVSILEKSKTDFYKENRVPEFGVLDGGVLVNDDTNNNSINNNNLNNNSIKNNYCASVSDDTKPEPEAAENTTSSVSKKKASAPNRKEANELFERLWPLYPSKKGKGQVSDRKKAELLKVGYEEMSRAIKRYKECLEKDADWRKPQNGSTFFNSGYIDYLDKNYNGAEDDGTDDVERMREEFERYADLIPEFPEDADLPFG